MRIWSSYAPHAWSAHTFIFTLQNSSSFTFLICLAVVSGTKAAQASSVSVFADGLDNPRGLSFGADGSLYVTEAGVGGDGRCIPEPSLEGNLYALQYANQPQWTGIADGSLVQIAPDGTRTTLASGNGLESATALTVGPDGAIYVSNKGDRAGVGQVLRIETAAVPKPTSALGVVAFGALGVTLLAQAPTLTYRGIPLLASDQHI